MEQQPNPQYFSTFELPPGQNPLYRRNEKKNLSRIGLALFLYLIIAGLTQTLLMYVSYFFFPRFFQSDWFFPVSQIVPMYLVGFLAFYLMLRGMPKKSPEKIKLGGENWVMFFAVSFLLMYVGSLIANFLMKAMEILRGAEIPNIVSDYISNSSPVVNFILVVLCAPIFEELMFRKLLIDRMLPYSPCYAVLTSGLIFGLIHGNFYQFFYAFFLGTLFAFVYVKTGKLRYTIGMHMILNFTGSIIVDAISELINGDAALHSSINPWRFVDTLYMLALLTVVVCGGILFFRNLSKFRLERTGDRALSLASQFRLGWGNIGMLLFGILILSTFILNIFFA